MLEENVFSVYDALHSVKGSTRGTGVGRKGGPRAKDLMTYARSLVNPELLSHFSSSLLHRSAQGRSAQRPSRPPVPYSSPLSPPRVFCKTTTIFSHHPPSPFPKTRVPNPNVNRTPTPNEPGPPQKVEMLVKVDKGVPKMVRGDKTKLKQVLIRLLPPMRGFVLPPLV